MAKKLFITNERMLALMKWAIDAGHAETETDYLKKIGFPRTNIRNVRVGSQSFTKEHIHKACALTGASADYIFGFQTNLMRKPPKKSVDLLKEAVMAVEADFSKRK